MYIYEILFRGRVDENGTAYISGQHVKYADSSPLGEIIGSAQPVTGDDVQAIVGDVCTMQAEAMTAKDAQIAELKAAIEAKDALIAQLSK